MMEIIIIFNNDKNYPISFFNKSLAEERYDNKFIEYHSRFFKVGITEIIKMWIDRGCIVILIYFYLIQ